MVTPKLKIVWSHQAKDALRQIYDYYKNKSPQGARNVRNDLLQAPKKIVFARQYQLDDINPRYRRIIVRDYKILYLEEGLTIYIVDIISALQSPEILANK